MCIILKYQTQLSTYKHNKKNVKNLSNHKKEKKLSN